MKNKKAIEPVVATVLLIVITIAAVALIIAFVVPFIQQQLGASGVCYKAQGIQIDSEATCHNETHLILKVVWNGNEALNLTKIRLSASTATETKTLTMPLSTPSGSFSIPKNPGEEVTWTIATTQFGFGGGSDGARANYTSVSIAPVIKPAKGNEITCDIRSIAVERC
ncbi:MAG: hypothetical protein QXK80_01605 [Candidatus Pacearchaeota archaeon]